VDMTRPGMPFLCLRLGCGITPSPCAPSVAVAAGAARTGAAGAGGARGRASLGPCMYSHLSALRQRPTEKYPQSWFLEFGNNVGLALALDLGLDCAGAAVLGLVCWKSQVPRSLRAQVPCAK